MAFNQLLVKSAFIGAATAFAAPLAALNGSSIVLNTKVTGSTTSAAGLVIPMAGPTWNIEFDSLAALVQTAITTTSLLVATKWQVSPDGTNWLDFFGLNAPANVAVAAVGTGAAVTTQYVQSAPGVNPGFPYMRLAALNTGATGGAADLVNVSYFFRRRWIT